MKKTILIAGAGGFIGTRMVNFFLNHDFNVLALDRFYFGHTLNHIKNPHLKIIKADIRSFDKKILKHVDTVINLASISNDPASELNPEVTSNINYKGAIHLAKAAQSMGVKKYILASSCSVYGMGEGIVDEKSPTYPLSEYARSKVSAEKELLKIGDKKFCITVLRLATVYGLSERRMRFDLIINLMTLSAWKNKKIFILGGGKQWRPLIHIDDCIKAFEIIANYKNISKISNQIINIGSNEQNYQVYQVANILKKYFPEVKIDITPDDPDLRSYRVSFKKSITIGFKSKKTIENGILEIKSALEKGIVNDDIKTNTSTYYRYLIDAENVLSDVKLNGKLF